MWNDQEVRKLTNHWKLKHLGLKNNLTTVLVQANITSNDIVVGQYSWDIVDDDHTTGESYVTALTLTHLKERMSDHHTHLLFYNSTIHFGHSWHHTSHPGSYYWFFGSPPFTRIFITQLCTVTLCVTHSTQLQAGGGFITALSAASP